MRNVLTPAARPRGAAFVAALLIPLLSTACTTRVLPPRGAHSLTAAVHMCMQLLFKLSIRASNGSHKLLNVVKNPITDHLPPNCHITLMSVTGRLVHLPEYIPALPQNGSPAVFVAGAMAHGKVEADYAHDTIAVSEYPLSGAAALGRLCNGWENHLGIL